MRSFSRKLLLIALTLLIPSIVFLHVQFFNGKIETWFEPTPIMSVVGLVIGFLIVSWQLDRQHRNTLEANRLQAQNQLKLEIYKEIARPTEATGQPLAELANMPTFFVIELKHRTRIPMPLLPSRYSFDKLQDLRIRCSDSVIRLMTTLENYEIALPGFAVFSKKLGNASASLNKPFEEFISLASVYADPKISAVQWPPSADDIKQMEKLGGTISELAWTLTLTVEDLRKAAQNFLLGKLFPKDRAQERKPADPTVEVTRLPSANQGDAED